MKKYIFGFVITSSTLITACNFNNKFKILGDNDIVYGKVKFVTELEYEMHIKFDELQIDKPSRISYYWFDEMTNLIKEKEISGWKKISDSILYEYDVDNRLIKKVDFFQGKISSFRYHYKENQLVDEVDYINDSIIKKVTYEYSNSNKKRKETHITGKNDKIVITEFDDNGNKTSERTYNTAGTRENSYQYSYNEKGLLLNSSGDFTTGVAYIYNEKYLKTSKKDALTTCENYQYENFDNSGNWLKLEYYYGFNSYPGEGHRYLIERKIKYY